MVQYCYVDSMHLERVLPDAAFPMRRLAMRMSVHSSLMPACGFADAQGSLVLCRKDAAEQ